METNNFNLEFLMKNIEEAYTHLLAHKDLKLVPMEYVLIELTKLFKQINSFLGIAFQDVHDKVAIIRRNKTEFSGETALFSTIKKEMNIKVHNCNGSNNKKSDCPEKYKKDYISTSRSFLRMLWFMTFLNIIFEKALEEKREKLSAILDYAYEIAFSKNHGFIVRNGARLAIKATPGEEVMVKAFIGKYDIEEFKRVGGKFQGMLGPIVEQVWEFYKSNGIDKLE